MPRFRNTGIAAVDEWPSAIIGADEAGWGAMAGPLVVAAAAAPVGWSDPKVKDSKQLSASMRQRIFESYIVRVDDDFPIATVEVPAKQIDEMGPQAARLWAFKTVVEAFASRLAYDPLVVLDGDLRPNLAYEWPILSLPKADAKVPEVGLASIVAKVTRDRKMAELAETYPGYGFDRHFGYVTAAHQEALEEHGPCPIHRRSYSPVARVVRAREEQELEGLFLDDDE